VSAFTERQKTSRDPSQEPEDDLIIAVLQICKPVLVLPDWMPGHHNHPADENAKSARIGKGDARIFGNTAILLEDMDLQAVVGAHEVTNAFMVTEVYSKENGKWKLAQLTFSHLLRPVKVDSNKN
jgi:hypothetical protein